MTKNLKISKSNSNIFVLAGLVVVVLVGIYFRLKGLNRWPLALDEYYVVRSIQNILEKGIPEFDAGGYYSRGIIYQYLTAGLVWTGLQIEFASRILPVIFNIAAIPALFRIGKKISGNTTAILLIIFFSLSLWEIEISRFARMYTFFQTVFIWYLLFYYKYLFEDDEKAIYWTFGLSLLSVFIYEASIFLVVFNFLLFFWDQNTKSFEINFEGFKNRVGLLFLSLIIFIVAFYFITYDFRTLGAEGLVPLELKEYFHNLPKVSKIRFPLTLITVSPFSLPGILLIVFAFIPTFVLSIKVWLNQSFNTNSKLSLVILLLFSSLNLYGLLLVSLILFLLLDWIEIKKKHFRIYSTIVLVFLINLVAQNIFSVYTTDWHQYTTYSIVPGFIGNIKILWKEFLNYPNFYELFALFRDTYKWHTIISILILFIGISTLIYSDYKDVKPQRIFFVFFIILLFAVTFLNTKYFETRYFFFLFPLFFVCLLVSLEQIIKIFAKNNSNRNLIFIVISISFFIVSEDSNINHLLNIDSIEVNFRKNLSKKKRDHFYPRWDSRSVAKVVNENMSERDIVISDEQISSFYLTRLNFLYRDYRSNDFKIESVNKGKNERWTNSQLIFKYEDLIKILSDKNYEKWFIINKTYGVKEFTNNGLFEKIKDYLFYSSEDGTTFLYKIPANPF